jgi:hypothetical protein
MKAVPPGDCLADVRFAMPVSGRFRPHLVSSRSERSCQCRIGIALMPLFGTDSDLSIDIAQTSGHLACIASCLPNG